MKQIIGDLIEILNEDMLSHGLLSQCVEQAEEDDTPSHLRVRDVLAELLSSGEVEVGEAKLASPDYVEFIAWKGTVESRVRRAMESANSMSGHDKEFAYWLCLRKNVDRFEEADSLGHRKGQQERKGTRSQIADRPTSLPTGRSDPPG
jgi:hypothetical protein